MVGFLLPGWGSPASGARAGGRGGEGGARTGPTVRRGPARDLTLEHQLLDRARYLKVLAAATQRTEIEALAFRLITAHSATMDWLTIVLALLIAYFHMWQRDRTVRADEGDAEDALGGPAALRRTPLQAVAGTAVRWINTRCPGPPGVWTGPSKP
ncbi:hypothetical protein Rhow_008074 [Rhodococcus wratislaviensis]|uniref:Uncharacterized protein n=1 Tax=Rhodococcus wratislaviensis TaxID=44752 RepID=A0A402CJI4_RHOWR|nr:hypothetical protein Rhow_008074 [Rhodococcus wratislaviensis]